METLSTSVSTLQLHTLPWTTPREQLNIFKPHSPTHALPTKSQQYNKPNPIPNRSASPFRNKPYFTSPFHSTNPTSPLKPASPIVNRRAATGYAAALLDVARCNNTLNVVGKDVRRLSRWLRNEDLRAILIDPFINNVTKGNTVKEVLEKGRFQKNLVVVVMMLIEKNKVGMVNEVLEEFERIYEELNGTKVVFVSSAKRMEEEQLFGIAKKVQKMSGAVKVKVRTFIKERTPSFAM